MEYLPNELHSDEIVAMMQADTARRVQSLKDIHSVTPGLAILSNNPDYVPSVKYMGMKERQGQRLGMHVVVRMTENAADIINLIQDANEDPAVHGVLPQFPLRSPSGSGEIVSDSERLQIVSMLSHDKDIDGVNPESGQESATMRAIITLMEHYNIIGKDDPGLISIIGRGVLVGAPLYRYMKAQGLDVVSFDKNSSRRELYNTLRKSKKIVTASGNEDVLSPLYFINDGPAKTLIDAGSGEKGGHGDVSEEMRAFANSEGWLITPRTHGVGPITVQSALAATVNAAEKTIDNPEVSRDFYPQTNHSDHARQLTRLPAGWGEPSVADYPREAPEILDLDYPVLRVSE